MMFILLIVIAILIFYIVNPEKFKEIFKIGSNKNPYEILKERYAKGEITKEEFEKIKNDLDKN